MPAQPACVSSSKLPQSWHKIPLALALPDLIKNWRRKEIISLLIWHLSTSKTLLSIVSLTWRGALAIGKWHVDKVGFLLLMAPEISQRWGEQRARLPFSQGYGTATHQLWLPGRGVSPPSKPHSILWPSWRLHNNWNQRPPQFKWTEEPFLCANGS